MRLGRRGFLNERTGHAGSITGARAQLSEPGRRHEIYDLSVARAPDSVTGPWLAEHLGPARASPGQPGPVPVRPGSTIGG